MPRSSVRLFPSNDQTPITVSTIVQQSRITFTGQRGLVWCAWKMDVEKLSVGNIDLVVAAFNSNFSPVPGGTGVGSMFPNGGARLALWAFALIQDPPENGFVEIEVQLSAGSLELKANAGVSLAMSFGAEAGEGPTVVLG